ncbi:cyclase/dehydrase family protein [Venturia nashicola]|nr:cyclase/dehydrase family protein [Venturia nashicola]
MNSLRFSTPIRAAIFVPRATPLLPTQRRFITPPTQTLNASRTLPYPSQAIYSIIADVERYSTFLPYCKSSKVTKWSRPDPNGKKWPSEAELVVGWKGLEETFRSQIYCVPGSIVEAVGGRAVTTLRKDLIQHHRDDFQSSSAVENGILTQLLTRWTVRDFPSKPPPDESAGHPPKEHTQVSLTIEYQFSNPMYSAMSGAVADKVAGFMIEAFEGRVKAVLDGGTDAHRKSGVEGVMNSTMKI